MALFPFACASESSPPGRVSSLTSPDGGKCAASQFLYADESCNPPGACPQGPDAGKCDLQCEPSGDRLCHQRCSTDADCTDPARPHCRILGLFAGYDWNCNVGVRICRETDKDDCPQTPPTLE